MFFSKVKQLCESAPRMSDENIKVYAAYGDSKYSAKIALSLPTKKNPTQREKDKNTFYKLTNLLSHVEPEDEDSIFRFGIYETFNKTDPVKFFLDVDSKPAERSEDLNTYLNDGDYTKKILKPILRACHSVISNVDDSGDICHHFDDILVLSAHRDGYISFHIIFGRLLLPNITNVTKLTRDVYNRLTATGSRIYPMIDVAPASTTFALRTQGWKVDNYNTIDFADRSILKFSGYYRYNDEFDTFDFSYPNLEVTRELRLSVIRDSFIQIIDQSSSEKKKNTFKYSVLAGIQRRSAYLTVERAPQQESRDDYDNNHFDFAHVEDLWNGFTTNNDYVDADGIFLDAGAVADALVIVVEYLNNFFFKIHGDHVSFGAKNYLPVSGTTEWATNYSMNDLKSRLNNFSLNCRYTDPYAARPIPKSRTIKLGDLFLDSNDQRFVKQIFFRPYPPTADARKENLRICEKDQIFNTFTGFGFNPAECREIYNSDPENTLNVLNVVILGFFRDYLCGGDTEKFTFFMNDIAHQLWDPTHPFGHFTILFSVLQGTGKSFTFSFLQKLFGQKNANTVSSVDKLFSSFTSEVRYHEHLLIAVDDAFSVPDQKAFAVKESLTALLKTLSESPVMDMRELYKDSKINLPVYFKFFYMSNTVNTIPLPADIKQMDRRAFVIHLKTKKNQRERIENLVAFLEKDDDQAYKILFHFFVEHGRFLEENYKKSFLEQIPPLNDIDKLRVNTQITFQPTRFIFSYFLGDVADFDTNDVIYLTNKKCQNIAFESIFENQQIDHPLEFVPLLSIAYNARRATGKVTRSISDLYQSVVEDLTFILEGTEYELFDTVECPETTKQYIPYSGADIEEVRVPPRKATLEWVTDPHGGRKGETQQKLRCPLMMPFIPVARRLDIITSKFSNKHEFTGKGYDGKSFISMSDNLYDPVEKEFLSHLMPHGVVFRELMDTDDDEISLD